MTTAIEKDSDDKIEFLLWPVERSAENESLQTYRLVLGGQYKNTGIVEIDSGVEVDGDYIDLCTTSELDYEDDTKAIADYEKARTFNTYLLSEAETACSDHQDTIS